MKVFYISPINAANPRLFPAFQNKFPQTDEWLASHCFLELHSGDISYDNSKLKIVLERGIPIVCFDNREYGPMQKEEWSPIYEDHPIVYFVRNMDKTKTYPSNVFPYDWPYFEEWNVVPVTKDELFSRSFDCWFTGTESPTRKNLIEGLLSDGRLITYYEFREHTQRIEYNVWVMEHAMAKCFISCDGGGFTEERIQQLFATAAILKNKNNHRPNNPFTDKINCIEVSEHPTKDELDDLVGIVNDKEKLYEIYLNGISHVKKYYSKEYMVDYVLGVLRDNEM